MPGIFGKPLKSVIQSIVFTETGRICMLKIRLQGTLKDIQWFRRILEKHKELDVLEVSDAYANKGTSKYFRVYVEVEEKE
jgi:hypothetical protein